MIIIRGAVFARNTKESISQKSLKLVETILERNNLQPSCVSGVFFTATADLDACYPAELTRKTLLPQSTAFMCAREMAVAGGASHCIRVAVFADTDVKQENAVHCYLDGAEILRPDLCESPDKRS